MHLLAIGLDYKSTGVEVRESLSLTPAELTSLLNTTRHSSESNPIHECVIVSTCNRLEVYAAVASPAAATETIIRLIGQARHIAPDVFRSYLYCLQDEQAVQHLMRVAGGLDSMILGEAQILGQLVTAYETALAQHTANMILSRLFQMALHAGKRVRTETAIGCNPASVSSVAVQLAQHHLGDLSQQVITVVGAGEMGRLTLQALISQGVKRIQVVSRSRESAEKLATAWQKIDPSTGEIAAFTLADLADVLSDTDVIIASTAATQPVLQRQTVAQALVARPERPLLVIDIGLPRDVEPTVNELAGVHLYNLDDIKAQIDNNLKQREREIPHVEMIIDEEISSFWEWYHARAVVRTITHLRQQFEGIKQQELDRTLKRMQHLTEQDQELVAELAYRLVNKFLHGPTVHLKAEAARGNGILSAGTVHQLFGLEAN